MYRFYKVGFVIVLLIDIYLKDKAEMYNIIQ